MVCHREKSELHAIHISAEAQADIDEIAEYTTSQWGWRQTDTYLA